MRTPFNLLSGLLISLALITGGTASVAHGALLDSSGLLAFEQRTQHLASVEQALAQEALAARLAAMGVDAAAVSARLGQLTDEELQLLAERLDQLPAGAGLLEIIGIVFVVLLILELVGVTDIFKAI
ncbi:MAG: PA2779 family protein [Gammaproteobacteria bacterium]|nr:PA2779 family protein [Gammaproteobacteria bacterium]